MAMIRGDARGGKGSILIQDGTHRRVIGEPNSPLNHPLEAAPQAAKPDPGADFLRAFAAQYGPQGGGGNAYSGQFQAGLEHARGNIADQLHGALADIENSRQKAGQALGQYAPMVNNDWQEAQKSGENALNVMSKYDSGAGVGQLNNGVLGAGRQAGTARQLAMGEMAPEMAASAATHREDLSDQALLNTGIQQQTQHESALANLAAQQAQGQLDQQAMQYQQAMAVQASQNAAASDLARQQAGYGLIAQTAHDAAQAKAAGQQANINPATGIYAASGLTQSQVDSAHKNKDYGAWNQRLMAAEPGSDDAAKLAGNILYSTAGNPALQATLISEYPSILNAASGAKINPMIEKDGKTGYMVETKEPYSKSSFMGRVKQFENIQPLSYLARGLGSWTANW